MGIARAHLKVVLHDAEVEVCVADERELGNGLHTAGEITR